MNNIEQHLGPIFSFGIGELPKEDFSNFAEHNIEEISNLELLIDSLSKFLKSYEKQFIEFDRLGEQSSEFIAELRNLGLFSLIIPEAYGGLGLSAKAYAKVLETITRYDGATALTVGAHSSIGLKGVLLFGSEDQKQLYLPRLASGELIAAFCLTESEAGSDVASLRTTATKAENGGWHLNGEKIWITNAPIAGFFTVFARTGDLGSKGISAFIVERDSSGLTTGLKEDKMGIRASATGSVFFNNVYVPAENLLGEEGQGFKQAMMILNNGRSGLGGGCIGSMKRCLALSLEQANNRKQFGNSLKSFELIQSKLANVAATIFATEAMVKLIATYIDNEASDYSLEAAASKVFATDRLWSVAYESLQIAGGNGFMKEYPYELITRDARINMIYEGTNEILRLFIGFKVIELVGNKLKESSKVLESWRETPKDAFKEICTFFNKRIAPYAVVLPTNPLFSPVLEVKKELKHLSTELSSAIFHFHNVVVDSIRRYKTDIKNEQVVAYYLADMAIELLALYASLIKAQNLPNLSKYEVNLLQLIFKIGMANLSLAEQKIKSNNSQLNAEVCKEIVI
jgi:acyl-CoA dehydrogenase family member 9